jgi:hypothetical protein
MDIEFHGLLKIYIELKLRHETPAVCSVKVGLDMQCTMVF